MTISYTIIITKDYYIHFQSAAPPSACTNLTVTDRSATSLAIAWDPPNMPGRSDVFYTIDYSEQIDFKYINATEGTSAG